MWVGFRRLAHVLDCKKDFFSIAYDSWANLTGVTSTGAGESGSYSLSYAANGSGAPSTNRINNSGYTFDSAGNITNDGNLAYAYDAASRLKTAGGDAYQYDGDGHRVRNQVNGYSNALYYLWSSVLNQPVVEIDSTTPSVFRAYVYGSGGQTALAVLSYDANFYWLHTDVLGSGRKMTDSSGAVTYRAEYDPHGQMVFESATGGSLYLYLNSHKFTGYERDWSTNLNNAKARTYNHNRARFMQPDPLSLGAADATNPQSLNLYSYVQNDPVNYTDPTGLLLAEACYASVNWTLNPDGSITINSVYYFCVGGGSGGGGGGIGAGSGGGSGQGNDKVREDVQNALNDKKCQKFVSDVLGSVANKKNPLAAGGNFLEIFDKVGIVRGLPQGAYKSSGGSVTGSIKGGDAKIYVPSNATDVSRRVFGELFHAAGNNRPYSDQELATAVKTLGYNSRAPYPGDPGFKFYDRAKKNPNDISWSSYFHDAERQACPIP